MEDFSIALGLQLKNGEFEKIQKDINKLSENPIVLKIDDSQIETRIKNIRNQLDNLNNCKINVVVNSNINSSNITKQVDNIVKNTNQTVQKIKPVEIKLINSSVRKEFEEEINGIIQDEQKLFEVTRNYFGKFGEVTTKPFRNAKSEITGFTVEVKNVNQEIESLKYNLANIENSKGKVIGQSYQYSGSTGSDNYARQLETDRKQTERNTAAVTNYTSKLKILKDEYLDVNASKPIQNSKNIEHLNSLYDEAIAKVNTLGTATKESFASSEASVKAAIAEIRSQVKIYREVESMANQLRAKPIETIKGEQIQLLREFEAKIKSIGIALEQLKSYSISDLSVKLGGVTDRQSLTEYLNMLVVAKAEFKALQAEQQIGKQAEKAETDKVTTAYKELLSTIQQIRNIQTNLLKLDGTKDSNQILELEAQLERLQATYQATRQSFDSKFSTEQTAEINSALQTTIDKMATVQAKINDVKKSGLNSIKGNIENGTLENQIATIENNYRRLGKTEDEINLKTQELRSLLGSMKASGDDIEKVTGDYTQFGKTLVTLQNEIKTLRIEQQKLKDEANLANKKTALTTQIDLMFKKYSAAIPQFGARLQQIKNEIESADDIKLTNLKREVKELESQIMSAGKATMTLGDKLKSKLGSLATYFSASMMISYAINGVKSMFDNVLKVDTAMTELYRVTDLTDKQYSQLYDNMVAGAKKYGVALNDIIESTASWVRLGFEANTANKLAEITAMYQHVTDLDNDTAVKDLVTAYKGYQDELLQVSNGDSTEAVMKIADVYDKLGNEFAVTAANVGESLQRSASSLQMAGNTFEEAAGMNTGIVEVTQNAEQAGTTLNVVSLRLRGMKGQLEEIGEEVDENVESISKMQTHILNLTNGKVNIFKDNGDFKSTYQIFKEISTIWNELTDTSRADLLETVAGKQRANSVAALINNWSNVEKAVNAASNAEGTAAAENEKYMQSMEGKLDALNASWQALSNTVLSSDLIKFLVDGSSGIVDIVDGITHAFGALGTTIAAVGITAFIKNLD
ncbi:MAG: phage tail tape measure protein [Clostridia bacterium]|nr:phage tail tape measure protein [Clostridia bacterium]MBQ9657295.1 phage tail tape measure protein [Clostridia bacterium]